MHPSYAHVGDWVSECLLIGCTDSDWRRLERSDVQRNWVSRRSEGRRIDLQPLFHHPRRLRQLYLSHVKLISQAVNHFLSSYLSSSVTPLYDWLGGRCRQSETVAPARHFAVSSNNPLIWWSAQFQHPTISSLFLTTVFSIYHERGLPCYGA